MCGIAGYFSVAEVDRPQAALDAMLAPLRPRGPDGEGRWFHADEGLRVGLGHRRLAILDLTDAAAQPMHRQHLTLIYNGEIYNYLELRRELEGLGQRFASTGDAEVLLAAYQQWDEGSLDRLNGMFAFAIFDARTRTLFCARDRAGEKPFYYFCDERRLVLASEIKAVLAFGPPVPRAPRWDRVAAYLQEPYQTLQEQTFFEGVRELLPGHRLCVSASAGQAGAQSLALEVRRFWSFPEAGGQRLAPEELRELLDDSVRIRLRSDVPVGTCLSGGIDSPSIAAAVVAQTDTSATANFRYQGVHAFAPVAGADERPYVEVLAKRLNIAVEYVEITAAGCLAELDELAWRQEVPFASPSIYAQRCVFRRAGELGLKVMLDGQGADELFGGYDWAVPRALAALAAQRGWIAALRGIWSMSGRRFPFFRLLRETLGRMRRRGKDFPDELHAALAASLENYSLPALLRYADRNSMSFGVEARLPFLDPRLIAVSARLQPDDVVGQGQTKRLLRRAVADRLPAEIAARRDKSAFEVPDAQWVRNELREAVREAVHEPFWRELDFAGGQSLLRTALGETEGGAYNRQSWRVLCVARWRRAFFK